VAAHDDPALELEVEVLADCFDGLEQQAVDRTRDSRHGSTGMQRHRLDALADEHAQGGGRSMDAVALRHRRSPPCS
jgi:hypothetical protein